MTAHRRLTTTRRAAPRPPQRGAALLVALVLLTVVATLSASMVWQQWRAVQVEAAERSRTQSAWILMGALDWARLILRTQSGNYTSLNDTWAQPLAEARLSTFLAADRDNNLDSGPEAFLSGRIEDAQSRYNLRNLMADPKLADPKLAAAEQKVLERLCQTAGLATSVAEQLAQGLRAAWTASATSAGTDAQAPLEPKRIEDLAWLGIDASSLAQLQAWVVLLPAPAPVNLNTAAREVLAAVIEGIDLGSADRLVQARLRSPFQSLEQAESVLQLPTGKKLDGARVTVKSTFFEVHGRLRLDDRVLEETSLVHKLSATEVVTIRSVRVASVLPGTGG